MADKEKNPIDIMMERIDKQDEVIADLRKAIEGFAQLMQKNMPSIVETINKQSEILNKHSEVLNNLQSKFSQPEPAPPMPQATAQQPTPSMGSMGESDFLGSLVNLGLRQLTGQKPTNLDQMVYNIVPQFFEQMFSGMITQMNLVNQLLSKRIGGEVAKAIGVDVNEGLEGFTK